MPKTPLVFISYSQADNEYESGALGRLGETLSHTLRFVSGNQIDIFHEGTDVALGQQTQERISQSLREAMVLVPVITPSFFTDPTCTDILSRFLERERQLGRNDLVLAVYYQPVPDQEPARAANHALLRELTQRRMLDWQPLRGKDFKDPEVRRTLESLARRIIDILKELEENPPIPPHVPNQAEPAPPDTTPLRQPTRQLTMTEITRFADLLLACSAIQDQGTRDAVLAFLPDQVRNAIPRHSQNRVDVINIVKTCNNFPGAIATLIEGIRAFDEGTFAMQAVDAFWNTGS